MTTIKDYHPRAAGFPWVRKEDYAAFLAICEDAHGLPCTWEQFAQFTEEAEHRAEASGLIVVRAYIDPESFPSWCASRGEGVNSKGRMAYSAFVANEKYGRDHG